MRNKNKRNLNYYPKILIHYIFKNFLTKVEIGKCSFPATQRGGTWEEGHLSY